MKEIKKQAGPPEPDAEFKPYIGHERVVDELTGRALVLGSVLGIVFAAANAYLGMKIGMTISASIPAAVMSMAILRGLMKRGTILENNIVQTIASSGESLAAGVIFTIPGFLVLRHLLRADGVPEAQLPNLPSMALTFLLTLIGGFLGALAMIPLRRYLIVQEHRKLPFPEGTACAEVLVAGETGGARAKHVFSGIGVGALYMFLMKGLRLFKDEAMWVISGFHRGAVGMEASAALLGVGFIIGPRIACYLVAGAALGWLVLIPIFGMLGDAMPTLILAPGVKPISEMSSGQIASSYIRYIGAGAVALGGIVSLIKALPIIISSFRHSMRGLMSRFGSKQEEILLRTDQDLPMTLVLSGAVASALAAGGALYFVSSKLLPSGALSLSALGGVVSVLFAFFFIAVAARIVGLVGSSSSPVSGMTITSLLAVCVVLVGTGFAAPQTSVAAMIVALTAGAVVCVAVCSSGDICQDLKTGFLVGSTPWRQQIAELIAVIIPSIAIVGTVYLLLLRGGGLNTLPVYEGKVDFQHDAVVGEMEENGNRYWLFESAAYGRVPAAVTRVTLKNGSVLEGKLTSKGPEHLDLREKEGIRRISMADVSQVFSYEDKMGELRAPQANIMAILVKGVIQGKLPWVLVFLGVFIGLVVELLGISSLPFAIGLYLGIALNLPIFIGGMIYWALSRLIQPSSWPIAEQRGVLVASGIIAGDALMGIALAMLAIFGIGSAMGLRSPAQTHVEDLITLAAYAVLTAVFIRMIAKSKD